MRATVEKIYKLFLILLFFVSLIGTFVSTEFFGASIFITAVFSVAFFVISKIKLNIRAVLTIAFLLRVIAVFLFKGPLMSDYLKYHEIALSFINGLPFDRMYVAFFPHTAFHSFFISVVYRIFSPNPLSVYFVNIILGTLSVYMVYKCTNSEKSAFLFGIFPVSILYTPLMATEIPFCFFILCAFYFAFSDKSIWCGIFLGIANLFRPIGIIFLIAYFLYYIFYKKKSYEKIVWFFVSYGIISFVSKLLMESFLGMKIPFGGFGYSLFVGMNEASIGRWNEADYNFAMSFNDPFFMHETLLKGAVSRFSDIGILGVFKLFLKKFAVTYGGGSLVCFYLSESKPVKELLWLFVGLCEGFKIFISFIFVKAVRIKKFDRKFMLPILFVLGVTALHLLTETMERYVYVPLVVMIMMGGTMKGKNNMLFKKLLADINAVLERDPASKSRLEVYFLSPGVKALRMHRYANFLWKHGFEFWAKSISMRARKKTGIEIHPAATIGKGVMIDHGMGVVIGETAVVGDNCTIYQNVTLGGTGKDTGKRHPTIGNNVMIGSGAKVLGPFTVGDNSKIAANAVVLSEVPPNSTCVGVPARVVKQNNKRISDCEWQMDQTHIPDPVSQELCKLLMRIEKLEKGETTSE